MFCTIFIDAVVKLFFFSRNYQKCIIHILIICTYIIHIIIYSRQVGTYNLIHQVSGGLSIQEKLSADMFCQTRFVSCLCSNIVCHRVLEPSQFPLKQLRSSESLICTDKSRRLTDYPFIPQAMMTELKPPSSGMKMIIATQSGRSGFKGVCFSLPCRALVWWPNLHCPCEGISLKLPYSSFTTVWPTRKLPRLKASSPPTFRVLK